MWRGLLGVGIVEYMRYEFKGRNIRFKQGLGEAYQQGGWKSEDEYTVGKGLTKSKGVKRNHMETYYFTT